ncbi:MAG: hypothetical protein M1812_002691 [Candelaria pacifica]|nr:MAG: hypothetical protein M1812_002691 [Candelaria pacifica]
MAPTQNRKSPGPKDKPSPPRQNTKPVPKRQKTMVPMMTKAKFQSLLAGEKVNIWLGKGDDRGIAFVQYKELLCHFSPLCKQRLKVEGAGAISFQVDLNPESKATLRAVLTWMTNGGDTRVMGPNPLDVSGLDLTDLLKLVNHLEIKPLVSFLVDRIASTIPSSDCTKLFGLLRMAKANGIKPLEARITPAINRRLALMGIKTLLEMYRVCDNLGLDLQKEFIVELIEPKFRLGFLSVDHVDETYKVSKVGAPLRTLAATSVANRMVSGNLKTPKAFVKYAQDNEEFRADILPIMVAFDAEGVPCHLGERRPRNNRKRAATLPVPDIRPQNVTWREVTWRVKTESQRVKPARPGTSSGAATKTLEEKKAEILAELVGKPIKVELLGKPMKAAKKLSREDKAKA